MPDNSIESNWNDGNAIVAKGLEGASIAPYTVALQVSDDDVTLMRRQRIAP
jgi:hypothetical protein